MVVPPFFGMVGVETGYHFFAREKRYGDGRSVHLLSCEG